MSKLLLLVCLAAVVPLILGCEPRPETPPAEPAEPGRVTPPEDNDQIQGRPPAPAEIKPAEPPERHEEQPEQQQQMPPPQQQQQQQPPAQEPGAQ